MISYATSALLWVVFSAFIALSSPSRILAIYPVPMKSFFYFNEAILKTLHSAGHHITFVSPFPEEQPMENYTCVNSNMDKFVYIGQTGVDDFSSMSTRKFAEMMAHLENKYCNEVMQLPVIQEALSGSTHYDLMFIGMIQMYECYFSIAEALGIPVIGTVNYRSWMSERSIGNPFNPAVVPLVWSQHGRTMSFYQRIMNTWNMIINDYLYYNVIYFKLHEFNKMYFPNAKSHSSRQPALMFINNHLTLQSRPMVPNAIEIGGIHIQPKKSLPKDLEKFISEAKHGVILFSFGSVLKTSSLSSEVVNAFVEAFAVIPQRVVWKFEDPIAGLSDNVYTSSWLPQRDILDHENVKVFISHGGLGGIYEAIHCGTPVIISPFFCDQRSNAASLIDLGVGIELDLQNVTKWRILQALNTVINTTSYSERMRRLSSIFKNRPISAQEAVVYWTEYVIEYGGASHLRSVAADMPLYQYLLLDVIAIYVAFFLISFWVIRYILNTIKAVVFAFIRTYYRLLYYILETTFGPQKPKAKKCKKKLL